MRIFFKDLMKFEIILSFRNSNTKWTAEKGRKLLEHPITSIGKALVGNSSDHVSVIMTKKANRANRVFENLDLHKIKFEEKMKYVKSINLKNL